MRITSWWRISTTVKTTLLTLQLVSCPKPVTWTNKTSKWTIWSQRKLADWILKVLSTTCTSLTTSHSALQSLTPTPLTTPCKTKSQWTTLSSPPTPWTKDYKQLCRPRTQATKFKLSWSPKCTKCTCNKSLPTWSLALSTPSNKPTSTQTSSCTTKSQSRLLKPQLRKNTRLGMDSDTRWIKLLIRFTPSRGTTTCLLPILLVAWFRLILME